MSEENENEAPQRESLSARMLGAVERVGNKLPDPTVLFIALLVIVWVLSWLLSYLSFDVIDPRSGEPIVIINQLTGSSITAFLMGMVTNFVTFGPVGTVLVAMLGIGVAEHSGFITTGIRALLNQSGRPLSRTVSTDLGFVVGPRINAAGRLEDMSVGIECLLTDDPVDTPWLALPRPSPVFPAVSRRTLFRPHSTRCYRG